MLRRIEHNCIALITSYQCPIIVEKQILKSVFNKNSLIKVRNIFKYIGTRMSQRGEEETINTVNENCFTSKRKKEKKEERENSMQIARLERRVVGIAIPRAFSVASAVISGRNLQLLYWDQIERVAPVMLCFLGRKLMNGFADVRGKTRRFSSTFDLRLTHTHIHACHVISH